MADLTAPHPSPIVTEEMRESVSRLFHENTSWRAFSREELAEAIAQHVAAEREACAKWHDEQSKAASEKAMKYGLSEAWTAQITMHDMSAAAIRARGASTGEKMPPQNSEIYGFDPREEGDD